MIITRHERRNINHYAFGVAVGTNMDALLDKRLGRTVQRSCRFCWRSTAQRALAATSGLILRKLPKPRFSPFTGSNIDLGDLTVRDFNIANPVKAVVDIILNHRADIDEMRVKQAVMDGDMESLPDIAKSHARYSDNLMLFLH